jgi:hypothetical protein
MLAIPASTAAAPRVRSQACWNPAVAPPPAAGGEEGRPVDPLGVVADVVGVSGVVAGVVAGEVAGVLVLVSGGGLPVSLEATGGPGDGDPPGEGVEAEQADTAAEMSIATVAQPMMASIALSLTRATAGRTFMEPPDASRQVAALFSGHSTRNRHRKGAHVTTGRWPKADPRKPAATKVMPIDGGHTMK